MGPGSQDREKSKDRVAHIRRCGKFRSSLVFELQKGADAASNSAWNGERCRYWLSGGRVQGVVYIDPAQHPDTPHRLILQLGLWPWGRGVRMALGRRLSLRGLCVLLLGTMVGGQGKSCPSVLGPHQAGVWSSGAEPQCFWPKKNHADVNTGPSPMGGWQTMRWLDGITDSVNMNDVGKVMSLLFNMLPRFIITFLPKSKCLLISLLQSLSTVIWSPRKWSLSLCPFFPHLPWSDVTKYYDLSFLNVEF